MNNYMKAYRFSNYELEKMVWLKQIFERSSYTFSPDCFPEVYYEDYEEVIKFINIDQNHRNENHRNTEGKNPDYLGIYIPEYVSETICTESKDGIIILFKNRIERYADGTATDITSVRFVVLMHELGHWLSHMGIDTYGYWNYGFNLHPNPSILKEALAQLIAYWACEDNEIHFNTLFGLSPKKNDGTIDDVDKYGAYRKLICISKVHILKKLSIIRNFWFLKDNVLYDFLSSDLFDISEWAKSEKIDKMLPFIRENKDCVFLWVQKDWKRLSSMPEPFKTEVERILELSPEEVKSTELAQHFGLI
jgi:hypothetical protein